MALDNTLATDACDAIEALIDGSPADAQPAIRDMLKKYGLSTGLKRKELIKPGRGYDIVKSDNFTEARNKAGL